MPSVINSSTSSGVVITPDTSGALALQTANTTALSISSGQVVTLANALPASSGGTGQTNITFPSSGGTAMVSGNMPAFSVYVGTTQTISSGNTKVAYDTKVFDTASCFNTSTYRFTPNVAGYYQFNVSMVSSTTFSIGEGQIWKNGGSGASSQIQGFEMSSGAASTCAAAGIFYMNGSTDYVEAYIYSSASSGVFAGSNNSIFSGCLIRGA
jgi:hypothetical protein